MYAHSTTAIFLFFILAFGWSWGLGLAAARVGAVSPGLGVALMIGAGAGPSLAGLAVVALSGGRAGLRAWGRRCLRWRVGWRWLGGAFLVPPALMVCALGLHAAAGGALPARLAAEKIPLAIANFALVFAIGGPLGEELGWRGYAMPALTDRLGWRAASLGVGVIWGAWHLPLFFVAGTAQAQMSMPLFLLNILAGSVLFGWLLQRTRGSVVPALVMHTSLNAFAGILGVVPTATTGGIYAWVTGLLGITALVLLLLARPGPPPEG